MLPSTGLTDLIQQHIKAATVTCIRMFHTKFNSLNRKKNEKRCNYKVTTLLADISSVYFVCF